MLDSCDGSKSKECPDVGRKCFISRESCKAHYCALGERGEGRRRGGRDGGREGGREGERERGRGREGDRGEGALDDTESVDQVVTCECPA